MNQAFTRLNSKLDKLSVDLDGVLNMCLRINRDIDSYAEETKKPTHKAATLEQGEQLKNYSFNNYIKNGR